MKESIHMILMIGVGLILGTAGVNLIHPVSADVLPLVKLGFYTGCFCIFLGTIGSWFD